MAILMCCGSCGIEFSVPDVFYTERLNRGGNWYCPNGHSRAFKESQVDKLRRERDSLQQQIARVEEEKRMELAAKEREIKRIKKRTAAGTCPCCRRTFSNMSEHMKHQHPDYVRDAGAKVVPMKRKAIAP